MSKFPESLVKTLLKCVVIYYKAGIKTYFMKKRRELNAAPMEMRGAQRTHGVNCRAHGKAHAAAVKPQSRRLACPASLVPREIQLQEPVEEQRPDGLEGSS